jgi:hypothetical protein
VGYFKIRLARIRSNEYLCAALILGAIVALTYGDVVFLGNSLSPATYNAGATALGPYGYDGRRIAELPVIDPMAAGQQMWPLRRLVAQYLFTGKAPLWNPYLAGGTPLAADTILSAYAPTIVLDLLPNELWDLRVLTRFWLAGWFTYVLLRDLKLRRPSALTGAVLYMLSGSFTWYSTHDWIDIPMLTPLVLFSVGKLAEKPRPRHICLAGVTFALCVLGAHIESVILQFTLVVLYFAFQVWRSSRKETRQSLLALASSSLLGFGLSAFFLLPVFEYLANSSMSHVGGEGLFAIPALAGITSFVPYFLGGIGSYWRNPSVRATGFWGLLGGYVGISCLFLSVIAILSPTRESYDKRSKQIPLFFFVIGVMTLLKSYGVPPVNWVGYLPLFDRIIFPRYLGSIWTLSFAITGAFGIEALILKVTDRRTIVAGFFVALLTILSLASLSAPYVSPIWSALFSNLFHRLDVPFSTANQAVRALYSVAGGLLQASVFLLAVALISNKILNGRYSVYLMFLVVVLEMSSYVPLGLHPLWQAVRSLVVLSSVVLIVVLILQPITGSETGILRKISRSFSKDTVIGRTHLLLAIVLCTVTMQSLIGGLAPMGLPRQYDQFKEAPYIAFLRQNAKYHRVYSFDGVLPPDFCGVFGLYTVGIMSAFNVKSFGSFVLNNLDSGAAGNALVSNQWPARRNPDAPDPVQELARNIRFYDLLGVKYVLAVTTDPNSALQVVEADSTISLTHFKLVYTDETAKVYENPTVLPRAFVVHRFRIASSFEQAQEMIRSLGFDLREWVVLDASPSESEVKALERGPMKDDSTAEIVCYEPDKVVIRARVEHSGFLVLTDTFYLGWNAYVDGRPTRIYQADGLVRAVYLGEGEHLAEFIYSPESFKIGLSITMISIVSLLALAMTDKLRSRIKKIARTNTMMKNIALYIVLPHRPTRC